MPNWTKEELDAHMRRLIEGNIRRATTDSIREHAASEVKRIFGDHFTTPATEDKTIGIDPGIFQGRIYDERELGIHTSKLPKATGRMPRRAMNKNEASYAAHLDLLLKAGDILWYGFEALKLRLGHHCYLTPDFLIMYRDGHLELHDTKGRKAATYYAEEDAIVKARAAGATFPIPIYFVWRTTDGEWLTKEM